MSADPRSEQLKHWLTGLFDLPTVAIFPASGDASFRRYFRFDVDGTSYVAMDAPPDKEDTAAFIRIARRFRELGLNVPEIFETEVNQGFLLLSDLGAEVYLAHLDDHNVERLYGDALGALAILQAGTFTDPAFLPDYDNALLHREMELFREWYLHRHLGLALGSAQHRVLDEMFSLLAESALAQPRVWVHRDYHSRNLMVTQQNNPGILDFQDAVLGPVTYDLVSLLRDCYIRWPKAKVADWVGGYFRLARHSGLPVGEDEEQFLQWFDRMGVQRHLKAIGIFARLCHRDGKQGYLGDIPRTLGYVVDICRHDDVLAPLAELMGELGIDSESVS